MKRNAKLSVAAILIVIIGAMIIGVTGPNSGQKEETINGISLPPGLQKLPVSESRINTDTLDERYVMKENDTVKLKIHRYSIKDRSIAETFINDRVNNLEKLYNPLPAPYRSDAARQSNCDVEEERIRHETKNGVKRTIINLYSGDDLKPLGCSQDATYSMDALLMYCPSTDYLFDISIYRSLNSPENYLDNLKCS